MSHSDKELKKHLVKALESEDSHEKNYHIRQALQVSNVTDLPEDLDIDSGIPD